MRKIMVFAAHPDDEILGLGGTIRKLANQGNVIECIILGEGITSRNGDDNQNHVLLRQLKKQALNSALVIGYSNLLFEGLPDNQFDKLSLLEITHKVENHIDRFKPECIFTHHIGDLNIDHEMTARAVLTACRPQGNMGIKEIYAFETPSSSEWNLVTNGDNLFKPTVFVDISSTIDSKLEAMDIYQSEIREYPHPRSLRALRVIAERWGTVANMEMAEAFSLMRKFEI